MTRRALDPNDRLAINAVLVSARQAIDIICDRWSLTLLLALFQGERRFGGLLTRTGKVWIPHRWLLRSIRILSAHDSGWRCWRTMAKPSEANSLSCAW